MDNLYQPLVSVVVITYNSSKYVIETLESIKSQTFENLELIVSDDCSIDDTVEICMNWMRINNGRFIKVDLITTEVNTGIPGNCNRGVKAAQGEWIKIIAGDDIILKNGIESLISVARNYNNIGLIHGRVIYINENGNLIGIESSKNKLIYPTFEEEFRSNKIKAPSVLYSKECIEKSGYFKEDLKIEDIYMYLKILSLGFIIYYVNKPIVKYRIHSNNHSSQNTLVISEHLKILNDYRSSEGFKLNYYIFCKNVILNLIQANKFSLIPIKILLNKNIILTFILIDITFWYKFAKILVKKLLNKKK